MSAQPALSFVIPLYNSAETIGPLVKEIEALAVPGGHELVLVNDGSRDGTAAVCRQLLAEARIPIIFVNHARNFGEHNAVLSGYRQARGRHVVNLDDDGQNPPAEAVRMWRHAVDSGVDVVYGHYAEKKHSLFRNLGSWLTNRITDLVLDKPRGFYLSSFRCVAGFVAKSVAEHAGPFPYVDGLLLQTTQAIAAVEVRHAERKAGQSGYTMRRLFRLWLSTFINFSVMPLRLATLLGLVMASGGLLGLAGVVYLRLTGDGPGYGWGSLMAALLVLSGTQLVILGLIGEYVGRMFLAVNGRPQSIVRSVELSAGAGSEGRDK